MQPETWQALAAMCEAILEPVRERYGVLDITYGFASPALMRAIPAHIAPALDQHVSCERNSKGNLVCPRRGAALDFRVPGNSSRDVAIWIADTLPIDRLYFYGADRPLHVSHGPDHSKILVAMLTGPSGRRVPRKITLEWLKAFTG